jgi:HEAT repeat protein
MIMKFKPNIERLAERRDFSKLATCLKHKNRDVVRRAIESFRNIGDENAFQEFTDAYSQLPAAVMRDVDTLLASDTETLRWIRARLRPPTRRFEANLAERVAGFEILRKTADREFVKSFIQSLESQLLGEDEVLACFAAEGLRLLCATSTCPTLIRLVAAGTVWSSEEAGRTLAAFSVPSAFSHLRDLSENPNLNVKRSVALAMQGYRTEDAAKILTGWIEDPDRSLRRIARKALEAMGGPARITVEQKLGKERSMKLFPILYSEELRQKKEEQRQREEFLTSAFSSLDRMKELLMQLGMIKPKDHWLKQQITTEWYWENDAARPFKESREEAGEIMNIDRASAALMKFWENPQLSAMFPGYVHPEAETRRAFHVGNRLGIVWKGHVIGEYGNHIDNEWRMTVVRLGTDSFFVLSEQKC